MNHEGSEVKIKDIPPILNVLAKACSVQYKLYPVHFTVPLYKCNQGFIYLRSLEVDLVVFVFQTARFFPGMMIRSDSLILGPPDPDPLFFSPPDPDPLFFGPPDPD